MDHDDIEDRHVAERYLMGKLPASEAARFEEHYLTCQACLDRLELAERFAGALKGVAAEEAASSARLGILAALARLSRRHRFSAAAVLALLLVLPLGLLRQVDRLGADRDRLASELSRSLAPQANLAVLRLSPQRSGSATAEPVNRITLSSSPEWIVLSLELGDEAGGSHRATLLGPGGEQAWHGEGLERDVHGSLTLSLHSSFLETGDYRLSLEQASPTGDGVPSAAFSFRVVR